MNSYIQPLYTRFISFAFLAAVFAVGMVACDSGPAPTYDNLTGTITGQVIDKVSSDPIEGATVTVAAGSLETDGETLSATTNADGEFTISNVPVTRGSGEFETSSAAYGLRIETNNDAYRDSYRGQVEVRFGDGGSSAVEGLVANVTFPLSQTSGTVSGRAVYNGTPLNNAELGFVQQLPVQFDGEGNATQTASIRTTTVTTDSDGYFTFENAEVDANFQLEVLIADGDAVVASGAVPAGEEATVETGEINVAGQVEPLKITQVSPEPESDVATTDTSITIAFNRPVVDNQYTSEELAQDLNLSPFQAKSAKALQPDDDALPIEISFDSTRTELTVTPTESLEDGFIYNFSGSGFGDNHFTDAYGIPVANTSPGNFNFSVGIDNAAPATPDVSFQEGYAPSLDYPNFDNQVNADMVLSVDNSEAEVKGYEVYARTQNMREDRTGEGGQFKKVSDVEDELQASSYQESDGIVAASAADMGGTLEIFADINDGSLYEDSTPLAAEDGSYGAIEVKVRAVSINNVRSDFSDVIAVGDSTQPQVQTASASDTDGDGNDDIITVEFHESLDTGTASNVDNYTLMRSGTEQDILDSVESVNNVKAQNSGNTEVVISVTADVNNGTDEIIVDDANASDPVEDLAGNGVDPNNSSNTVF